MAYEQLRLENQICFRLYSASRLVVQHYQPYLSALGITYTQYLVLMVLWERDPLTVSGISERLGLESNTLTPLLKRLEKGGVISRGKQKDGDGRQTLITLTGKGRDMEKKASGIPSCLLRDMEESGLSAETLSSVAPLLDEIISKLSSSPSGDKDGR